MGKIREKFNYMRKEKRKAFIPYLTFGYPDISFFKRIVKELEKAGADFIEVGLPFSDPIADGPIIQESSRLALKSGANVYNLFCTLRQLKSEVKIPFILMTYSNPIYRMGFNKFFSNAKNCIDGIIVSDMLVEESKKFIEISWANNIDTIFFISPLTSKKRWDLIKRNSSGFIYYISVSGVTGPRSSFSNKIFSNIREIKQKINTPVCVGFGISNQKQARRVKKFADGIIVGSAIIKKIEQNKKRRVLLEEIRNFSLWLNG